MQIRRITINNLNSLRGTNELNFDQPPLKEAGLFAIMGPTGSGKSTLLDAICLALFNRVPRMPMAVSRNEIESKGSIVTHHCKEASAEVEYTCSAGTFISRWSIKMNRNGNWNDYHMELENKTESKLEPVRRAEVPARNESLIGLNYDQFVKSMLLAQGDFAKFLKSSAKERVELLEKITNGEIYRKLGKLAFEKFKGYDELQQQLKARIAEEEKKMAAETDFEELKKNLEEKERSLQELDEKLQQQLQWQREFRNLDVLERELVSLKSKWDACLKAVEAFHLANASKLQQQEALLPLEKPLDLYAAYLRELKGKQLEQQTLQLRHQQAQDQKKELLDSIASFTKSDSELEENGVNDALQQMKDRYGKLLEDITVKRTLIAAKIQYFKSSYSKLLVLNTSDVAETALQVDTKIASLEQSLAVLKAVLEAKERENPQEAKTVLQTIKLKVWEWQKLKDDLTKINKDLQQLALDLEENNKELKRLEDEEKSGLVARQNLEKELAIAKLEYQNMQLRMSLDEHRKLLTEGEPCPLCGALHHPLAGNVEDDDQLRSLLIKSKELESELKQLNTALETCQSNINKCKNVVTGLEVMQQKNQQLQADKEGRLLELSTEVPASFRDKDATYFEQRINQLTAFETHTADLVKLQQLKEEWVEYSDMVKEGLSVQAALSEVYEGKDFDQRWSTLNTGWEVNKNALNSLKQDLEKALAVVAELENRKATKEAELMLVLQPLGYKTVGEALESRLGMQDYQRMLNEKNKVEADRNQQKHLYELKFEELNKQQEQLKTVERALVEQFVQDAASTKKKLDDEKNQMVLAVDREQRYRLAADNFRQQLAASVEEGRNWQLMKELIGDATGSKFSGFAQQLTLKQLTLSANRRLEQLDKRYVLVAGDSQKQELQVIDRDMGNSIRSVETLSGGETFLMSLALALGLSDLASHKVELGSLFIDEGFGTLDPDVLEKTIGMLEQLQLQDNKTIGIISHVEALKERIRVKVNVVKNGQGYSEVRI